jgi:hypothetical protein
MLLHWEKRRIILKFSGGQGFTMIPAIRGLNFHNL